MVERNSALRGERIHGRFGSDSENPGVTIQEIKDFSCLEIILWDRTGDQLGSRLDELLGLGALPQASRVVRLGGGLLLRPTDAALLYLGDAGPADILAATITAAEGVTLDRSHGYCYLRLGGPCAADLLRRGVRVDLRDAAFPVLSAMATDIGGLEILLLRPDARHYDLLVPRSRAVTFWRWLTRRAAQFGYEVV
jgi:heterotetrameric sarcosine oxidase gamma subunit